ncbi:MAG: glycosyltransferase family 39 protein [Acidimicrobiales bacterium]
MTTADSVDAPPPPPPFAGDVAAAVGEAWPVRVLRWFSRAVTVYWPILLVALAAFGIRVWIQQDWMPECTAEEVAVRTTLDDCYAVGGDASYYRDMATNVSEGNGYTLVNLATLELVPGADHPPGYITFLAGLNTVGLWTLNQHRLALAAVGSISVALMGLLGWRLGGRYPRATGVVAASLAATYPGYWMADTLYMSESFFIPFIVLTLLCAYRFWRGPGWLNAVWLGAAAGGAWLTRGEAALVLGFIVVGFVVFMRTVTFWRRFAMGVVACAVCVGMMTPWIAYNLSRFPEPIFIAATGPALALNSCDEVWEGDAAGFYSFGCLSRYTAETIAEDGKYTDAGIRSRATEYIRDNLTSLPGIAAIRVARIYGVYAIGDTELRNALAEGRRQDWVQAQQLMYYAMVAGGIVGLVALRRRRMPISPIVGPILAVAASVAGTFAIYRYRLAADTAIMAVCAVGITAAVGKLQRDFGRVQVEHDDPWDHPSDEAPDDTSVGARTPA